MKLVIASALFCARVANAAWSGDLDAIDMRLLLNSLNPEESASASIGITANGLLLNSLNPEESASASIGITANGNFRALQATSCLSNNQFDLEVSGSCTYENFLEEYSKLYNDPINSMYCNSYGRTAEEDLLLLLKAADIGSAKETMHSICTSAFETYEDYPFDDIAKLGPNFVQQFYNGGTDWNEEVETEYPLSYGNDDGEPTNVLRSKSDLIGDAARVNNIYRNEGQYGKIEWPSQTTNFDQCSTNAAMCCWPSDRQAKDNNGNCNTPYDVNCVDKDPGDNTNLCYVDMEKGRLSTGFNSSDGGFATFPFDDGNSNTDFGEGPIHCHGLAWSEFNENDKSSVYKGNNLFYISMYDHMHQRGYVRNIQGAPMCACTDQMPIVSRADCTQIAVEEHFKFTYDISQLSATLTNIDIDFQSCQGVNRQGNNQNNDLWAYMNRLFLDEKISAKKLADLSQVLVGNSPDNCDAATERLLQNEKGLIRGYDHADSEWIKVAGRGILDQTGSSYNSIGQEAFRAYFNGSPNKIIRRVCVTCVPSAQDVYYKRLTAVPDTFDLFSDLKNGDVEDENNVFKEDFLLYSTYEDAVENESAWDCQGQNYTYGALFPGQCAPGRPRSQGSDFDRRRGQEDVAWYIEKGDVEFEDSGGVDIGRADYQGSTKEYENKIYMTGAGNNLDRQTDNFHFWSETALDDDNEVIVKVDSFQYQHQWGKAGIMIRESMDADSPYFGVFATGQYGIVTQYRSTGNVWTRTSYQSSNIVDGSWLKLVKQGHEYKAYSSVDGITFDLVGAPYTLDLEAGKPILVGLALSGVGYQHKMCEVVFENYTREIYKWPSAAPSFRPSNVPSLSPSVSVAPTTTMSPTLPYTETYNLALGETASANCAGHGSSAPLANDGDTNGMWGSGTIYHARCSNPKWIVTLPANNRIETVVVWNRMDCCSARLTGATVQILNELSEVVAEETLGNTQNLRNVTLTFDDIEGSFVQILSSNYNVALSEVEVYGQVRRAGPPLTNAPSDVPSNSPTVLQTATPTTASPTAIPTAPPSDVPSNSPTALQTATPTTASPTAIPTAPPSDVPSNSPTALQTATPTASPTAPPFRGGPPPTTSIPTASPTALPTASPTESTITSASPTTSIPTASPTAPPTESPTITASPSTEFTETYNLALGGTASAKCAGEGSTPSRANDGNTDENWSSGTIYHAGCEDPRWKVSLPADNRIETVVVWNRMDDGYSDTLTGATVQILNETLAVVAEETIGNSTDLRTFTFTFDDIEGSFVQISGVDMNMDLSEVEVYGTSKNV